MLWEQIGDLFVSGSARPEFASGILNLTKTRWKLRPRSVQSQTNIEDELFIGPRTEADLGQGAYLTQPTVCPGQSQSKGGAQ